jgi:hypothetical protein
LDFYEGLYGGLPVEFLALLFPEGYKFAILVKPL